MKKILITGKGSFIGLSVKNHLSPYPNEYYAEEMDMENNDWKNTDFGCFDVVFHVAGIAHSDYGKISNEKEELYKRVNTELAIQTAIKAKQDGAKHFIFMSSAIVFGDSAPLGVKKIITRDSLPNPANCYGESKLNAENGILALSSESFRVAILRPSMIYGKGCKGNFPKLEKIARYFPIFPIVNNERSMLYIGNFVELVKQIIDTGGDGIYYPCNKETASTSEVVRLIAKYNNKKILMIKGFEKILTLFSKRFAVINKAFGNFAYSKEVCNCGIDYWKYSLEESIKELETYE